MKNNTLLILFFIILASTNSIFAQTYDATKANALVNEMCTDRWFRLPNNKEICLDKGRKLIQNKAAFRTILKEMAFFDDMYEGNSFLKGVAFLNTKRFNKVLKQCKHYWGWNSTFLINCFYDLDSGAKNIEDYAIDWIPQSLNINVNYSNLTKDFFKIEYDSETQTTHNITLNQNITTKDIVDFITEKCKKVKVFKNMFRRSNPGESKHMSYLSCYDDTFTKSYSKTILSIMNISTNSNFKIGPKASKGAYIIISDVQDHLEELSNVELLDVGVFGNREYRIHSN